MCVIDVLECNPRFLYKTKKLLKIDPITPERFKFLPYVEGQKHLLYQLGLFIKNVKSDYSGIKKNHFLFALWKYREFLKKKILT